MKIDEFEFRNKQGEEIEPTKDQLVVYIKHLHKEIKTLNKALELACEELYDSDSISVCSYCPHNLSAECPDICPSDKHILTNYFKAKAKEMMKSE